MKKIIFILALCPLPLMGQAWSGIINTSRAIDWTHAGVVGGVPSGTWKQCGSTISAGASAATIQKAINACGSNQYVLLGSGTFNLTTGLTLQSNMVLRGSGPSTILKPGSGAGVWCFSGVAAVCISADLSTYTNDNTYSKPGQSQAATWTAGYSQGSTSITVKNVGSNGIQNGQYIYLNQANDTAPNSNLFNCDIATRCAIEGGSFGQTI